MSNKKSITPDVDLMELPAIDGLVMDVRGQKAIGDTGSETAEAENIAVKPAKNESDTSKEERKRAKRKEVRKTALPMEGNDLWNTFLKYGDGYDFQVRKDNRKGYWIDEDIVATLKMCDINRLCVADMINAILRAFIELNKVELRTYIKHQKGLI